MSLDVYSRYVVGWMVAERESAALAEVFIAETCAKEGIAPDQLTRHADRGSAMTSPCVAHLLADLGVTKTHSRPQVSNDHPFSEAHFKTVKYHPTTPERFGSLEDARTWARDVFQWGQPRAPPHRDRAVDTGDRASRPCATDPSGAPGGAEGGLASASGAVRTRRAPPYDATCGGVDQSADHERLRHYTMVCRCNGAGGPARAARRAGVKRETSAASA